MRLAFNRDFEFEYGQVQTLSPLIRRVVAKNPSAFTFHGTGTYIIGHDQVAVIDPGPALEEHIEAVLQALRAESVTHIVVTHTHLDHSSACAALKAATGAPTHGYGPHGAGKIEAGVQVEEGGDMEFVPDIEVRNGDLIEGVGWTLESVYTPGHTSNHLCFALCEEEVLFSGDHVMGWSTSVISPPDGDMGHYMASLELLLARDDRRYWPTHGPSIDQPKRWVRGFMAHRRAREQQILQCVASGRSHIEQMLPVMYRGLDAGLHQAAAGSVFAAVLYLLEREELICDTVPSLTASYRRRDDG